MGKDLLDQSDFNGSFLETGKNIYEVVRIIDGCSLFLEDHLERLYNSLKNFDLDVFLSPSEINNNINLLIRSNKIKYGNIKIVLKYLNDSQRKTFFAYPVLFYYPTPDEYKYGVKTGIYRFTRPDPEVKVWNSEIKKQVKYLKEKNNWFEVIYQDESGNITEGSQSNVFIIKNKKIFTAPSNIVLGGITRRKIIEICKSEKLILYQKTFTADMLLSADTVFLTGTSPKVLPVRYVNDQEFSLENPLLSLLIKKYDDLITEYIFKRKH